MTANRAIFSAVISLLLVGCMAQYEDVSADSTHRELIGRDFQTTSDLLVHGVTLDRSYDKRVDLCSVTPKPGFSGPEVITRQTLPAGTRLHVVAVRKFTNAFPLPGPRSSW